MWGCTAKGNRRAESNVVSAPFLLRGVVLAPLSVPGPLTEEGE
jgi:hypothetical protein